MKKLRVLCYIVFAIIMAVGVCVMTACGDSDEPADTSYEEEQVMEEDAEEAIPEAQKVDKIDMTQNIEVVYEYSDEDEGYDREGVTKSKEKCHYVNSKLFKGNFDTNPDDYVEEDSYYLLVHMHEEIDTHIYDADGKEVTDKDHLYSERTSSSSLSGNLTIEQIVKNKDTGEDEELETRVVEAPHPRELEAEYGVPTEMMRSMVDWMKSEGADFDYDESRLDVDDIHNNIGNVAISPSENCNYDFQNSVECFYCFEIKRADVPVILRETVDYFHIEDDVISRSLKPETQQYMVIDPK